MQVKRIPIEMLRDRDVPVYTVRGDRRVNTGSSYDPELKRSITDSTRIPIRTDDVLRDLDSFVSLIRSKGCNEFILYADRPSNLGTFVEVFQKLMQGGTYPSTDLFLNNMLSVEVFEDSTNVEVLYRGIEHWLPSRPSGIRYVQICENRHAGEYKYNIAEVNNVKDDYDPSDKPEADN